METETPQMDWSAGLPHAKRWEASVVGALDRREPRTEEDIRREGREARGRVIAEKAAAEADRLARYGRRDPLVEAAGAWIAARLDLGLDRPGDAKLAEAEECARAIGADLEAKTHA